MGKCCCAQYSKWDLSRPFKRLPLPFELWSSRSYSLRKAALCYLCLRSCKAGCCQPTLSPDSFIRLQLESFNHGLNVVCFSVVSGLVLFPVENHTLNSRRPFLQIYQKFLQICPPTPTCQIFFTYLKVVGYEFSQDANFPWATYYSPTCLSVDSLRCSCSSVSFQIMPVLFDSLLRNLSSNDLLKSKFVLFILPPSHLIIVYLSALIKGDFNWACLYTPSGGSSPIILLAPTGSFLPRAVSIWSHSLWDWTHIFEHLSLLNGQP